MIFGPLRACGTLVGLLILLGVGAALFYSPRGGDSQYESIDWESIRSPERDQSEPARPTQTANQPVNASPPSPDRQAQPDPPDGARDLTAAADDDQAETLDNAAPAIYIVQPGDTAHNIARAHGLTLAELLELNDELEDPNLLRIGQELRVRPAAGETSAAGLMTSGEREESPAQMQLAPQPAGVTFSDGTHRVGVDIPPGRYRTANPTAACVWERLRALTDNRADIIVHERSEGASAVADVLPTDTAFRPQDCGVWSSDLTAITNTPTAGFGDGVWLVGTDLAPGRWTATVSDNYGYGLCNWRRLANFSGDYDTDVIADDVVQSGTTTVTILATDAGFESSGCGHWTFVAE